jgi:hypothetical protein
MKSKNIIIWTIVMIFSIDVFSTEVVCERHIREATRFVRSRMAHSCCNKYGQLLYKRWDESLWFSDWDLFSENPLMAQFHAYMNHKPT